MSTTITPTVGRVVWFYPELNAAQGGFAWPVDGEPLAAIIARVIDAEASVVHLTVLDASGVPHPRPYVQIIQEGEKAPEGGRYATWMPYQIGQAKKHAGDAKDEGNAHLNNMKAVLKTSFPAMSASTAGAVIGATSQTNPQHARFDALSMALRTPGLNGYHDVLAAAKAYEAHIESQPAASIKTKNYVDGIKATGPALLPTTSPLAGPFTGLTFGDALVALKGGAKVSRAGWNGKGMFAYLVPANSYPAQTGAAKAHFGDGALVPYNAYLALKGADDTVSTWAPSGSDALAEDWLIIE